MFWPTFDSVYCVQCYVFSLIKQSGCLFFFVFLFCCRRLSVLLVCDMRISDVCEQNRTKMTTMGVCDSVNDPPHPLDGRKNLARFLRRNCVWTNFLWFAIVSISKYAHAIWSSWAFYSRSSLIWQWFLSDGCCTPFSIRATSCNMFISMLAMWILNSERSHRISIWLFFPCHFVCHPFREKQIRKLMDIVDGRIGLCMAAKSCWFEWTNLFV